MTTQPILGQQPMFPAPTHKWTLGALRTYSNCLVIRIEQLEHAAGMVDPPLQDLLLTCKTMRTLLGLIGQINDRIEHRLTMHQPKRSTSDDPA